MSHPFVIRACAAFAVAAVPTLAQTVLIDGTTRCAYNDAIGTVLNGTSQLFPTTADPTIHPAPEPDLGPAASALGNWLATPPQLNANWQQNIVAPGNWQPGHEVARVYTLTTDGFDSLRIRLGFDNGGFVWWNGVYLGGQLLPGNPELGELTFTIAPLPAGTNYLQILCEDHGGTNGFTISVDAGLGAIATPFGVGCAGSQGTPSLAATSLPILAQTFALDTTNVPVATGGVFQVLGLSDSNWGPLALPAPLDSFGLTGCTGLVRPDAVELAPAIGTVARYRSMIPGNAGLLGLTVFYQSLVPDLAANNPAGATVSNAVRAFVGNR